MMNVRDLENGKTTTVEEWVIYYYDKDDGNEIKSRIFERGGNYASLHTHLFYFNQNYKVKSVSIRESTVIKNMIKEEDVSDKCRNLIDMWSEKHNK